jgi:hypothetical protein
VPGPLDPREQEQGEQHGSDRDRQRPDPRPALGRVGGLVEADPGGPQLPGQPPEPGIDLAAVDAVGGHQVAGGQQPQLGLDRRLPVGGDRRDPCRTRFLGEQAGQLGHGGGDLPAHRLHPLRWRPLRLDPAAGRLGLEHRLLVDAAARAVSSLLGSRWIGRQGRHRLEFGHTSNLRDRRVSRLCSFWG